MTPPTSIPQSKPLSNDEMKAMYKQLLDTVETLKSQVANANAPTTTEWSIKEGSHPSSKSPIRKRTNSKCRPTGKRILKLLREGKQPKQKCRANGVHHSQQQAFNINKVLQLDRRQWLSSNYHTYNYSNRSSYKNTEREWFNGNISSKTGRKLVSPKTSTTHPYLRPASLV